MVTGVRAFDIFGNGRRSWDVFTLVCMIVLSYPYSHDAVVDPDSEDKVHVAVDGLGGKFVVLYVGKKEGMEKEKLLADEGGTDDEEEEDEGGLWSRYSGGQVLRTRLTIALPAQPFSHANI